MNPPETLSSFEPSPVVDLNEYRKNRGKPTMDPAELKLIAEAQQGSQSALEAIWVEAQNVANDVANSYPTHKPKEDSSQTCLEVVPSVVNRYNPSIGSPFKHFLRLRMIGALQDEVRAHGREHGLSRNDYRKLRNALKSEDPAAALHELTQAENNYGGKTNGGFVMAPHLVYDSSEIVVAATSLDQLIYDSSKGPKPNSSLEPATDHDVFEEVAKNADITRLRKVIEYLTDRERQVVLHYHGLFDIPLMNMRAIGEELGITESRVSQIHYGAIEKLSGLWSDESVGAPSKQPKESSAILRSIAKWNLLRVKLGKKDYYWLQRPLPASVDPGHIDLHNNEPNRRKVGYKERKISILVKYIRRSDLLLAAEYEKQLAVST